MKSKFHGDTVRKIHLQFDNSQLTRVEYFNAFENSCSRVSIRGKTCGAYRGAGSFQWTTAVRALCVLLLRSASTEGGAQLAGGSGSLAASLDYAISKQPTWIAEMFGVDSLGVCNIRRMVLRTNSERKRPGPVTLSLNSAYLSTSAIEVVLDGRIVNSSEMLCLLTEQLLTEEVEHLIPVAA